MPFVNIYIHLVFSTKNRIPFLETEGIRKKVWKHVFENAQLKGIHIDCVNGHAEHCHCLISLNSDQTIRKIAQLIKGESSFWINKNNVIKEQFEWQDEYYAVSVSESAIKNVRKYILNQEAHHNTVVYENEFDDFAKRLK